MKTVIFDEKEVEIPSLYALPQYKKVGIDFHVVVKVIEATTRVASITGKIKT